MPYPSSHICTNCGKVFKYTYAEDVSDYFNLDYGLASACSKQCAERLRMRSFREHLLKPDRDYAEN